MTNAHIESRQVTQLARLQQFLAWIIPCNFGFAVLQALAFAIFGDIATGLTAAIIFVCSGILLLARMQVRHGQLIAAVSTMCASLLFAAVIVVVLQPALMPTLACIPLLAVTLALPYISGQFLRYIISVAWLATAFIVISGKLITPWSVLPSWFSSTFQSTSLIATVTLILLILWQFSSRLTDMLAQTQAAEERYAVAARGANDGLWDWDLVRDTVYFSPRWKTMLGYGELDIGAAPDDWFERVHHEHRTRVRAEIANHIDGLTSHFESEHQMLCADGRYRWMLSRGLVVRGVDGTPLRMAGSQTDITARKQIQDQLVHDAFHDTLTGLPNRALFMQRLNRAVTRSRRYPDRMFAILFLDLDRFKVINDSLGHPIGDQLLVAFARRLEQCVRETDTVARLGGDEFTILLDERVDLREAVLIADRVQLALAQPFNLNHHDVFTTASIGIALSNSRYVHADELVRDADLALYQAKAQGKARYAIFDQSMHTTAVALLELETDLRRAISRQEFAVYYQPIVSLETGQLTGFEALVRWSHPQRGLVSPAEFVPIAEETGLITQIGWFVLREACRQMVAWGQGDHHAALTVNVNVSGVQFAQPDLIDQIQAILTETSLHPSRLRLEITESVMMSNAAVAPRIFKALRSLNIGLHIDDFGTGYSSLSMLHHFPIDALKIDRSFITTLGVDGERAEIVQTVIALAQSLGMDVVAEGIETNEQYSYLRKLGCTYGQGYLFARPLESTEAGDLISSTDIFAGQVQPA